MASRGQGKRLRWTSGGGGKGDQRLKDEESTRVVVVCHWWVSRSRVEGPGVPVGGWRGRLEVMEWRERNTRVMGRGVHEVEQMVEETVGYRREAVLRWVGRREVWERRDRCGVDLPPLTTPQVNKTIIKTSRIPVWLAT